MQPADLFCPDKKTGNYRDREAICQREVNSPLRKEASKSRIIVMALVAREYCWPLSKHTFFGKARRTEGVQIAEHDLEALIRRFSAYIKLMTGDTIFDRCACIHAVYLCKNSNGREHLKDYLCAPRGTLCTKSQHKIRFDSLLYLI